MPPTLTQNQETNIRAMAGIERTAERAIIQNYQQALATIRKDMGLIYEKYAKGGKLTMAEMSKFHRLDALHKNIVQSMGPVFSQNGQIIERMSAAVYQASFYRTGWAIAQDVRADLNFGLLSPDVVRAAVQNPISGLTLHAITLEERRRTLMGINRVVTQGIVRGDDYPTMMREAKKWLGGDAKRAMTVVRTEGQRAYVDGQLAAGEKADDLGVDTRKVWDATLDSVTRPAHGALDGVAAGKDGMFSTEVGKVEGPLHSGVASFDINCRCRVTYEVVGYEPKVRRVRIEGGRRAASEVVPYRTYRQWVADKPKLATALRRSDIKRVVNNLQGAA